MAGWIYRENRVPYYQSLFHEGQKNHTRLWLQTRRSAIIFKSYQVVLFGTFGAAMYMMTRQVLGHKTWWGKG